MREFNVTGRCRKEEHYMVDISDKVNQVAAMAEKWQYFTINRARQYGKTTLLWALEELLLTKGYQVARISFEGIGDEPFENGKFNMELCIKKFALHYYEIYYKKDSKFLERVCRLLFLTYLRPLINGAGFYHIESEMRNGNRTDLIIDFCDEQFIVELKIWKGEQKHEESYKQLIEYLNSKNKIEGYLLTFDFRKRKAKKAKAKWIRKNKKKIFDCLCV
jgi:hypothetical protein